MVQFNPQRAIALEKTRHSLEAILTEISDKFETSRPELAQQVDGNTSINIQAMFSTNSLLYKSMRLFDSAIIDAFIQIGWDECSIIYSGDNGERGGLISVTLKYTP